MRPLTALLLSAILTPAPLARAGDTLSPAAPIPPARESAVRFFQVGDMQVIRYAPKGKPQEAAAFTPHIRVTLSTAEPLPGNEVFARVHYYDERRSLLATEESPIPEEYDDVYSAFPAFTPAERAPLTVRFRLPEKVLAERNWSCVIVFGDKYELTAAPRPEGGRITDYLFPGLVAALNKKPAVRPPRTLSPVIEHPCFTGLREHPKLTFFLKKPAGLERASDAAGVLAVCMLANSAADVRRRLEWEDLRDDYMHILDYAKRRRLLVVAWGSTKVWDGARDTWTMPTEEAREYDRRMETLAKAWEKGVGELAAKHGFKPEKMLLWGYSASAQYAHRLALRRPARFRAVYLHIPSSFDTPRPEASGLLWCTTTGERDGGYTGSLEFHRRWRELGALSFHKAVPGLGHGDSRALHHLVRRFFDLALDTTPEAARAVYEHPLAYGDSLNGGVSPADRAEWVPAGQRVPLPDAGWADAWELRPEPPPPVPEKPVPVAGDATPSPPPGAAPVKPVSAREALLIYRAELSLARVMRESGMNWRDPEPPPGVAVETPTAPRAPVESPPTPRPAADPDNTPFGRRTPKTPPAP